MNRSQISILISAFCIIFIIIFRLAACKQQHKEQHSWTPELEQQMRQILETNAGVADLDGQAKEQYVDCCMDKLKTMFPNGIASIENASDSLKMQIMKMGADCAAPLKKKVNIWDGPVVQQLKLTFYSYPETKLLPEKLKKEYVDCLSFNVVAKYPNGLEGTSKDSLKSFIEASRKECLKLLVNKYPKTPKAKIKADTTVTR